MRARSLPRGVVAEAWDKADINLMSDELEMIYVWMATAQRMLARYGRNDSATFLVDYTISNSSSSSKTALPVGRLSLPGTRIPFSARAKRVCFVGLDASAEEVA